MAYKYMSCHGDSVTGVAIISNDETIVKTMASKLIMACDELILDTVLIRQSFHYSNESYYI